ncbi:MAG: cell division topological specificity factor MinE [Synergistaceae bacterium]|jgi:cell division topological specificity factor|nr:cell division topological specificity factor MinE [Synergistaceae bacterium]
MSFLSRIFSAEKQSGGIAKDRLRLVLMHDRADISPELMENMKRDIILVLKNYLEIDEEHIDLDLQREDSSVALVANIPITTVRRSRRQH